jgi:hypothetical protein
VVWAELRDANGIRKVRPAVVLTPTAEIAAGKALHVLAVTTRLNDPLPDDHVLLPWDRQGKARSGLRRKCAAVTSWQVEIAVDDVQEVVGILPPATIAELLFKVAAAMPPPNGGGDGTSDGSTRPPAAPSS